MSASFDTAVADSKKLTSKPSNEELLELYGTSHAIKLTHHPITDGSREI